VIVNVHFPKTEKNVDTDRVFLIFKFGGGWVVLSGEKGYLKFDV